jgi:hypothetical protein
MSIETEVGAAAAVLPFEIARTGSLSLCVRARRMIDAGADPEMLVVWTRHGVPVFARPSPLRIGPNTRSTKATAAR